MNMIKRFTSVNIGVSVDELHDLLETPETTLETHEEILDYLTLTVFRPGRSHDKFRLLEILIFILKTC